MNENCISTYIVNNAFSVEQAGPRYALSLVDWSVARWLPWIVDISRELLQIVVGGSPFAS